MIYYATFTTGGSTNNCCQSFHGFYLKLKGNEYTDDPNQLRSESVVGSDPTIFFFIFSMWMHDVHIQIHVEKLDTRNSKGHKKPHSSNIFQPAFFFISKGQPTSWPI